MAMQDWGLITATPTQFADWGFITDTPTVFDDWGRVVQISSGKPSRLKRQQEFINWVEPVPFTDKDAARLKRRRAELLLLMN